MFYYVLLCSIMFYSNRQYVSNNFIFYDMNQTSKRGGDGSGGEGREGRRAEWRGGEGS